MLVYYRRYYNLERINVTSPLLPQLEDLEPYLKDIWNRKWLTNNGFYHQELEKALCEYLKIDYISLYTNGTLPLIAALQALRITGEVITTPYSFCATTHSIWWNGIKPVFVDIDPKTCNLDPEKIEAAITPRTTAIMPVHCYGIPCDVEAIEEIASKYGLSVIYDAAHAFGVEYKGRSILNYGDMSTLSFHATKVYNTVEGGALVTHDAKTKKRIDFLKNFGFADEVTIVAPGINGKMDEIRSAYGLVNLKQVDEAIRLRQKIVETYCEGLNNIAGIRHLDYSNKNIKHNYAYFPIFIDKEKYGISRDELYEKLKEYNIYGRRYFYPLISNMTTYRGYDSSRPDNLPVANKLADEVLCLPIYKDLKKESVEHIINIIKNKRE